MPWLTICWGPGWQARGNSQRRLNTSGRRRRLHLTTRTPGGTWNGPRVCSVIVARAISTSRERKRRVVIDEEQQICLDAEPPSERADAEVIESTRAGACEENEEPRRDRGEDPCQHHEEQDDDVRDREDQPQRDGHPIARTS